MTREEILEQWPDWGSMEDIEPYMVGEDEIAINEFEYNQVRTALLRVVELESQLEAYRQENAFQIARHAKSEDQNKQLIELVKNMIGTGTWSEYERPGLNLRLEQITNQ